MNCEQAQYRLKAVIGGQLRGDDALPVRQHCASCPHCASSLTPSQWVEVLPALEEEIEPSADFADRFYRRLTSRETNHARSGRFLSMRWPRQLAAAGVLIVILTVGILIGRYPGERQESTAFTDESAAEETLFLLKDMGVIKNLELLEDFEAIRNLHALVMEEPVN